MMGTRKSVDRSERNFLQRGGAKEPPMPESDWQTTDGEDGKDGEDDHQAKRLKVD
jgi:hypothetical protein